MSSQFLLISNLDTDVDYLGNWTTANSTQFGPGGSLGPPFEPQLHTLNASNGSFSFFFHGSFINVRGSIPVNISNSTNVNPSWECLIDGTSLGPPTYPNDTENNWSFCQQTLADGPHQLVVNVDSSTSTFSLDYLLYAPSVGISFENNSVLLDSTDPGVIYDSTWSINGNLSATSAPGGEVTITFVGQSLDYYGSYLFNSSHISSSAQYSVDGQPFVTFPLNNSLTNNAQQDLSNQKFFSTGLLKQDSHQLIIKNMGNSSVTPLTFDYGIIAFDTGPDPVDPVTPDVVSIGHQSKSHLPAIIGGAAGGAVVIAVILITMAICWRRRFRRTADFGESAEMQLQRATRISPLSITHPTQPSYHSVMTAPPSAPVPTSIPRLESKAGHNNPGSQTQPQAPASSSGSSRSGSTTLAASSSISKSVAPPYVQERRLSQQPAASHVPLQARMSIIPLNPESISATPLLEDWEGESEAPPPTYTSRPDVISAEKLRRYFKRTR